MSSKHTKTPWICSGKTIFSQKGEINKIAVFTTENDAQRCTELVNICEGQTFESIKNATDSSNAEMQWELLMMELVGEDGPGSVRDAVNKLKTERNEFKSKLIEIKNSAEIEDGLGNQLMARQIGELLDKYNVTNKSK
jgi:hypothetical protein